MTAHDDFELLQELLPALRTYQELAVKHGIDDIFQDNGGKTLQTLLLMGFTVLPGREGNDAKDADGREYELKTLNILKTSSFSTHHHLNPIILKKYRSVGWVFSVYEAIELAEVYLLEPAHLEPLFEKWEATWHERGGRDLNIPKSPSSSCENTGRESSRRNQFKTRHQLPNAPRR